MKRWLPLLAACFGTFWPAVVQTQSQPVPRSFEAPRKSSLIRMRHLMNGRFEIRGVADLARSPEGFLWMAGSEEIIRYDGYEFVAFRTAVSERDAKLVNWNQCILVDRTGLIWTGTRGGGLKSFNPRTARFQRYFANSADPRKLSDPFVTALCEDHAGRLWVGTRRGVQILDKERSQFTRPEVRGEAEGMSRPLSVTCMFADRDSTIWIGTDSGIWRSDRGSDRLGRYGGKHRAPLRLPTDTVLSLAQDAGGALWAGLSRGIVTFDPRGGRSNVHFPRDAEAGGISTLPVPTIAADRLGNVWIGTVGGGIQMFEASTKTFIGFKHDPKDESTIRSDLIVRVVGQIDGSGTFALPQTRESLAMVWVVTARAISQITVRNTEFITISPQTLGLQHAAFWPVATSHDGTVWVGDAINQRTGLFNVDANRKRLLRFVHVEADTSTIASDQVKQVFEDARHNVWVIAGGVLHRYQPPARRFQKIPMPAAISSVADSRDSALWVTTVDSGGFISLGKMDPTSGSFAAIPRPSRSLEHPSDRSSLWLYEDSHGVVWFGTFNGGLYSVDPRLQTYQRFLGDDRDSWSLRTDAVSSVVEDSAGSLWIGTHVGLHRLDRRTAKFEYVGHPEFPLGGVTKHFIRGLVYDGGTGLWIASDGVLSCFDIQSRYYRDYTSDNGLQNRRIFGLSLDKRRRVMYVTGADGLTMFYPDSLAKNHHPPTIVLTSFKIHNKPATLPQPVQYAEEFEVPYEENSLSFTFAALDFADPSLNSYAHKLEGFDRSWTYTRGRGFAGYSNLEPGSYTFRVKGSNSDGVWNEKGVAVRIVVIPPWYRSFAAYAMYLVTAAIVLIVAARVYRKRLHFRHEMQLREFEARKLREIDHIKSEFFANISHEFRTPLTLILGPIDRIKSALKETDLQEELEMIRRGGQRLLRLVNRLLDLSKVDAGQMALTVRKTDLVQFLRTCVASFASLADRSGITLKFEPEVKIIEAYVDREKLEEIINNLVSNAIKFTPRGGEVMVALRNSAGNNPGLDASLSSEGAVEIKVRDTGIGISPEKLEKVFDRFFQIEHSLGGIQNGTGIGLALAKELVELHRGSISAESSLGEGSLFRISLPIGKEHFRSSQIIEDDAVVGGEPAAKQLEQSEASEGKFGLEELRGPDSPDGRPAILVVEDNPDMQRFLCSTLDGRYRLMVAGDGEAGLSAAFEDLPDLVVSDLMMPKVDGLELCKALKSDERTSHVPVILLTARASIESKIEGLETGADDYITKPFDGNELLVRIQNLIEVRMKLREKYRQSLFLPSSDQDASSMDEKFLRRVIALVEQHLSDAAYQTITLAHDMCMSRMTLNRKLQALTGHSTHEFIRTIRLERAARLLRSRAGTVTEIAFEVGFSSVSHFSKAFHGRFGQNPSEFAQHSASRD